MNQVHKETLSHVENALPNRKGLEIEIFGMEGVPEDVLEQHRQRMLQDFYEKQKERQIQTGNPPAGSGRSVQPKKPRLETPVELKARLRQWLAQKAAGQIGPDGVPMDVDSTPPLSMNPGAAALSPGTVQSPVPPVRSPTYDSGNGWSTSLTDEQGNAYPPPEQYPPAWGPPSQAPPYQPPYQPQYPGQSMSPSGVQPFQPPYAGSPPVSVPGMPNYAPPGPPGFVPSAQNGFDPNLAASVDDLISSATKAAQKASTNTPAQEKAGEKKKKKDKEIQLVFAESHVLSPEEELARLPRYAFSKA